MTADPDLPVHRVAAIVWMDMPAPTYGDAAIGVETALGRWLDLVVKSRDVPMWRTDGRPAGTARIVDIDSLGHALSSRRLTLAPPLWETPARVREAAAALDREQDNDCDR